MCDHFLIKTRDKPRRSGRGRNASASPSRRFAAGAFKDVPPEEHPFGTTENAASPITRIAKLLIFSLESCISTDLTGPRVKPSANCEHSDNALPDAAFCCVNFNLVNHAGNAGKNLSHVIQHDDKHPGASDDQRDKDTDQFRNK